MPLSETDVQAVLAKLVDPNTAKDYSATRSVKSVKAAEGKIAVEIAKKVLASGFQSRSKTFTAMVTNTLSNDARFKRVGRGRYERVAS